MYACLVVIPGLCAGQCYTPGLPPWACPFLVLLATCAALWRSPRDGGREPIPEVTVPPSCLHSTSPRQESQASANSPQPFQLSYLPWASEVSCMSQVAGPTVAGTSFPQASPAHSVYEGRAPGPKNWSNSLKPQRGSALGPQ